jgi:hypothetical protein
MGMHGKWSLDLKGRSGLADFSAEMTSARTALVNAARGLTKSSGARLPQCGSEQMDRERAQGLSPELRDALDPLLAEIESLNARIAEYDRRIERIAQEVHPEVALLRQVKGVGPLISLTFVLTLDDPYRFRRSRDVGCFLGLRPGRRNSGRSEPQLHISKEGGRRTADGPGLRVDHRNSAAVSSGQADRQLCGVDPYRELQCWPSTAGTHQQAR